MDVIMTSQSGGFGPSRLLSNVVDMTLSTTLNNKSRGFKIQLPVLCVVLFL